MSELRSGRESESGVFGGEPGLEDRFRRLDQILAALEDDDLELERALGLFEEGVEHVHAAEKILAAAELRVEELLGQGERTRPLEGGEE